MELDVDVDEALLAAALKLGDETGRTFAQVLEDSLRMALAQHKSKEHRKPVRLHTSGGGGVQPGVDLSCNEALNDLMDEWDGLWDRWLKPSQREGP